LKKTCTDESCKNKPETLRKEVGYICIMLSFNHISEQDVCQNPTTKTQNNKYVR